MAQLNSNTGNFTPDNLIAGIDVPLLVKSVILKSGQGLVARGTVLGIVTVDGLAVKVNSQAADGSQTADCILVNDVDTAAGNVVAEAYISGHFNRKALRFGGSDTAAQHETKLRERGIFLSDNISY